MSEAAVSPHVQGRTIWFFLPSLAGFADLVGAGNRQSNSWILSLGPIAITFSPRSM